MRGVDTPLFQVSAIVDSSCKLGNVFCYLVILLAALKICKLLPLSRLSPAVRVHWLHILEHLLEEILDHLHEDIGKFGHLHDNIDILIGTFARGYWIYWNICAIMLNIKENIERNIIFYSRPIVWLNYMPRIYHITVGK